MQYVICDPEDLRNLCIRNNWFTCGSNRQYDKLFEMNADPGGYSDFDIELAIWVCSDNVIHDDIWAGLRRANDEYREMQQ